MEYIVTLEIHDGMFYGKTVADLHAQTDKRQHQCSLIVMFLL